ncbi:MAG: GNAT family N-acetyltransferase [Polyangiaceae bacterium]
MTSLNGLRWEVVTQLAPLVALAPEWDALVAASAHPEVVRGSDWNLTWWEVFGSEDDRQLRVLVVRDGDELVGLAPLLLRPIHTLLDPTRADGGSKLALPVALQRLELIGSGEPHADEICSDYVGIVAKVGYESAIAETLAAALGGAREALLGSSSEDGLGRHDELVLPSLPEDDVMLEPLTRALAPLGRLERRVEADALVLELPASWDDFLASRRSSQRYRIRRTLRRFEQWSGGEHAIVRADDRASLDRGLTILAELHEERWSRDGRRGAFSSPHFAQFHRKVLPRLFERGQVGLTWLVADGRPVAAQYNLFSGNTLRFYQAGRAMDLRNDVCVGLTLHLWEIARAIEEGLREYDFLAGAQRYKAELSTRRRSLLQLRLLRRTPTAQLFRAGWWAVDWARRRR